MFSINPEAFVATLLEIWGIMKLSDRRWIFLLVRDTIFLKVYRHEPSMNQLFPPWRPRDSTPTPQNRPSTAVSPKHCARRDSLFSKADEDTGILNTGSPVRPPDPQSLQTDFLYSHFLPEKSTLSLAVKTACSPVKWWIHRWSGAFHRWTDALHDDFAFWDLLCRPIVHKFQYLVTSDQNNKFR